jgi:hypothetical protein
MYKSLFIFLGKFINKPTLFKVLFNFSPMYRRSCGRIIEMTEDLHIITIKIKLSYKNRNYVGSMFGGSLFSATDPIYMTQLMQILGEEYVVWDKATTVRFKKPAYENAFAVFEFSEEEISKIKLEVREHKEIDWVKNLKITCKEGNVFTELDKTIYVAKKAYYKEKLKKKRAS